jgi:pimeloyl-ACP methyl ester carboxylesterase
LVSPNFDASLSLSLSLSSAVISAGGAQPVTLVGHSLGAAIAIMAAVSMTIARKPPTV